MEFVSLPPRLASSATIIFGWQSRRASNSGEKAVKIGVVIYFTSHVFHKSCISQKNTCISQKNLWNPWLVKYMTSRRPHQVMCFTSHVFHKSWISQVMDFTRKHMYFTSHEVMYFTKFSPFHPLVFPDLKRCRKQEGSRRRTKGTKVEDHGWVSVAVCFWNSRLEVWIFFFCRERRAQVVWLTMGTATAGVFGPKAHS